MPGFLSKILGQFSSRKPIDWDDLEESMIAGDLGVRLTLEIIEELRAEEKSLSAEDVVAFTKEKLIQLLCPNPVPLAPLGDRPHVTLIVGVNGTGKTTSAAKLAKLLKSEGHSVMLAAADTFRAAAIEQLEAWAGRIDVPIVAGKYKADPSSVCFDAHAAAIARNVDFLICDTAGRLHTRHNLMEELRKTHRVLARQDDTAPQETMLVVDATTGSNAVAQAKEFNRALHVTGLIATKLDGSGKGGAVAAIKREIGIPPRYAGTGESADDFTLFNARQFVEEML